MSKTVKQLADELGVSKTAVRKRFTATFRENYTETDENGVLHISDRGCELVAESLKTTANNVQNSQTEKVSSIEEQYIESLKAEIELLKGQLSIKDEQLASQSLQLERVTNSLAAAQQLHYETVKQLTEKSTVEEETPVTEHSGGFWSKLRKKK